MGRWLKKVERNIRHAIKKPKEVTMTVIETATDSQDVPDNNISFVTDASRIDVSTGTLFK